MNGTITTPPVLAPAPPLGVSTPAAGFKECLLGNARFAPARFCAPLAGLTHSAFRRLVAELGGCGALWTEMLAGRQILKDDFATSPWVRRRPVEGRVVFQLMLREGDSVDRILGRLLDHGVDAVDLNLACDAMSIRTCEAGSALFEDRAAMTTVATAMRRHWTGLLTAKVRLGGRGPNWEARWIERLRVLEDAGFDAVTVHPRFFEDKFGRRARLELIPWAASVTHLPVIANGDLAGPEDVAAHAADLAPAVAVMIGRMAVVRPWIFANWDRPAAVDLAAIWRRLCGYIEEDLPPAAALRRIKLFTRYFAANFAFAHAFRVSVDNAPTMEGVRERAEAFFGRSPATVRSPAIAGL